MDKENNVVYVETKSGIFKCYKSEQIGKPIYYPIESKTNGYIDCYDVIRILNIDDLYKQVKKQQEVINKIQIIIINMQSELIGIKPYHSYVVDGNIIRNMTKNIENILKEVSE